MPELKLVYRGLRQISDWALRFYSDVDVHGQENVPADGPLIIAACHHNEILDIATLSVTIPHRRPVCFWAKSTLFKNPVVGAILSSSGSIPVARNPNSTPVPTEQPGGAGPALSQSAVNEALFRETFKALEREEVIGVFPEGSSHSEPSLAQVKDGASRAALEYVKWASERNGKQTEKRLLVVPVGIVYTDKSQYQSKVCVWWGKPIDVEAFAAEIITQDADGKLQVDSREVIRALSAEIEKRILGLTINAPDWDTLYATRMARDILWAEEELSSLYFILISQNLVHQFTDPNAPSSRDKARQSLLKYYSLLHYSNISHSALNSVLPTPSSASAVAQPTRLRAFGIVVRQLLLTVLHPRFVLFFPTFVLHVPAYVAGALAGRLLGKPTEEETPAQFKAIFGGLAATAAYGAVTRVIVRGLVADSVGMLAKVKVPHFAIPALRGLWAAGRWLFDGENDFSGKARAAVGAFGIFYAASYVLSHWHNYWVGSNYRQFKHLLTSLKLFFGILAPRSVALSGANLAPYTKPYVPPPNPYIKRREGTTEPKPTPRVPTVSSVRLIRPLLDARAEATRNMWSFMVDSKYLHGLVSARMKGEAWMQVGPAKRHKYEFK
ncbi:glycerol-3-phosphate-1-acyltransferase [Lentinus tigrinus ALCF2SS1-7]|uniref:Glycerol-3-phosphate-1-acyltransferase n=1 Tax=Lentinus tigrinus ALCF2SS1-6 TaxID=1328759 RepID=A0A5C2SNT7_9APHY|nr:glycerol-3-phosphate-1-acyltransferase [Lentinus tigrinus ALCF2SS1-6]RPD79115.1 glycerol-3-phosphate-1-acyltransferase [Lentinus tigrinus ALCF2SS1-7]